MTIQELLSHTAGFTDYPKSFDMRKDYTEAGLVKIVERVPWPFPPGTNWSYSNLGYLTFGIVIHKVTGEFYGDFFKKRQGSALRYEYELESSAKRISSPTVPRDIAWSKGTKEPGVGISDGEHDGGRQPLFPSSIWLNGVNVRALRRKALTSIDPGADVVCSEAQRTAEFRQLRFDYAYRNEKRPSRC